MGMLRRATLSGFNDKGEPVSLEVSSMTYDWFQDARRILGIDTNELMLRVSRIVPRGTVVERDVITFLRRAGIPQPRQVMVDTTIQMQS